MYFPNSSAGKFEYFFYTYGNYTSVKSVKCSMLQLSGLTFTDRIRCMGENLKNRLFILYIYMFYTFVNKCTFKVL